MKTARGTFQFLHQLEDCVGILQKAKLRWQARMCYKAFGPRPTKLLLLGYLVSDRAAANS